MGKRPVMEFMLKVLNLLMILCGVSMVVLGAFYLIKGKQSLQNIGPEDPQFVENLYDPVNPNQLASVWLFYLLFAIGGTLFLISCLGYIGTRTRNPCYLSSYSILLFGLVLSELVSAAFLLCHQTLYQDLLHVNKDDKFRSINRFVQENWKILRWVILVALVLEVVALVLALNLWTKNRAVYDSSDDEQSNAYSARERISINTINNLAE